MFVVGFVIIWNLAMGFGVHLNGGFGPFNNLASLLVAGLGTILLSALCLGAVYSPAIRGIVLRSDASVSDAKPGLLFLGFLGSLLTILTLVSALKLGGEA